MKKAAQVLVLAIGASLILAGCSSSDSPELSKAQEDAARHPVADPNYKGPDPSAMSKMGENIAAYQAKHAHDKVEFNTGK